MAENICDMPTRMCVCVLSCVPLVVTPWTVTHQAPLSMKFSSKNTRVGGHSLLQGIFLTQGLNPGVPHCKQIATREAI